MSTALASQKHDLVRYSPVAHLASAIHPAASKRRPMLMLTAYFDETGHVNDPTLNYAGMAGLVADSGAWIAFEERWNSAMRHAGLREPFHMNEFAHSVGQFETWKGDEPRRQKFFGYLMSLILETGASPIAAIVRVPDFKGLTKSQQDNLINPYCFTFQTVTRGAAHEGMTLNMENPYEKVAMVYAHQPEYSGTAENIWYTMKRVLEYGHCLGSYATSTPDVMAPLQAADILAYEVLKEFEGRIKRPDATMRWGLRQFMKLVHVPPPRIAMFDRKELLRITKESNFSDQSNVEEVDDDQMRSVMDDVKRWSMERGGIDWEFKI